MSESHTRDLQRLAALCGIEPDYHDIWGKRHELGETSQRALLAAMGLPQDADASQLADAIDERGWRRALPPVQVVRSAAGIPQVEITLPAALCLRRIRWTLSHEDGGRHDGEFIADELDPAGERSIGGERYRRFKFRLPALPAPGYHTFELEEAGDEARATARMTLVVAPDSAYLPDAVAEERRVWGPAVQLYGLRSHRNWGIGDFTDLAALVDVAADTGAGIIGVNPLHALFADAPQQCSPYSPSSRLFLNTLYIDPDAVPACREAPRAQALLADPVFQERLARARSADLVDYATVAAIKHEVFAAGWRQFCERDLADDTEDARAFRHFQEEGGEALHKHCLFEALQAHFRRKDSRIWGWPAWPADFRDPAGAAVAHFADRHRDDVEFRAWLQWLADSQLGEAGHRSWLRGLGIGLYQDMALGVNPGGSETWTWRDAFALSAHAGAPPDDFNLHGQDWGLPPFVPERLRDMAYGPFIAVLRANMRHCGALRIDHVMALLRLFWIPAGQSPADGAYVHYAFDELLGILVLESRRNRCMVIGEDLGTVPDELRPALAASGVLSYHPFFFEHQPDGAFKSPTDYQRQALVAISTHDLPTLRGFWKGYDLDVRTALGLFPAPELQERMVVERAQDRARLLFALQRESLLPEGTGVHPVAVPDIAPDLALAVHAFLARTPAMVMVTQPEDIFGLVEQANLPGSTEDRHPNWQRRLPVELERWREEPRFIALAETLRKERGSAVSARVADVGERRKAVIPRATYRLQFNHDFTFSQATEVLDYLEELGISHVYASPYLKARPGSTHGYDIVDHNALNPEIGDEAAFQDFVAALKPRGMGQILDVVPNHMGVMGADNGWWLDVLENGQASTFAGYFDIDWQPLNPDLRGKVLLPLLGEHYGTVLNRGELKLAFDSVRGEISLFYWQHRLPIDPAQYPRLLGFRLERLAAELGDNHERLLALQSLITAFGHLPPHTTTQAEKVSERARDKEIHKRQLTALCDAEPAIAAHVAANIDEFNGHAGDPASFDLLHELIKGQAWRLAYWRIASDEINYRRFFDINDLAALRMENPAVFEATHRLVLELVRRGDVDGLRIDHPDGLLNPGQYFARLQARTLGRNDDHLPDHAELPLYLVIEKILAEHERLPDDWPIHGATGYRFANLANNLFVDSNAERRMTRIYAEFLGEKLDFDTTVYEAKKLILHTALASELNVLANQLARIAAASRDTCDYTLNSLREALVEVIACFPVYRSYLATGRLRDDDRRHIDWAVAVARKRSHAADIGVYDFLRTILTAESATGKGRSYHDRVHAFAMKFQQLTSPVMAKGLEDTTFYRCYRLTSLNDVGGEPRRFGVSLSAYHRATRLRAERWPHNLLATSTHDSKRAEDVRARINVLSEMPAAWKVSVRRWSRMNRGKKRHLGGEAAPSRNDEYLLYQTLVGTWPLDPMDTEALAAYRERIERYMVKAVREGKLDSSWINVNEDYEAALTGFVGALLTPGEKNLFLADFTASMGRIAHFGFINSLAQTLLKLTSPGVPDIYQGCELWQFNLVDPDNRRAVDYARRRKLLEALRREFAGPPASWADALASLTATLEDGRIKLYLIWRALELRRRWAEVFRDGAYKPILAQGSGADHVCAFARSHGDRTVVAVVPRLLARLAGNAAPIPSGTALWQDTALGLPGDGTDWFDVLSGKRFAAGSQPVAVAELLAAFPVALLVNSSEAPE